MNLPAKIIPGGARLYHVPAPAVDNIVVVYSRGQYRQARVDNVGPKRATVEYTTPNGSGQVTTKAVPLDEVYTDVQFLAGDEFVGTVVDGYERRRRVLAAGGQVYGRVGGSTLDPPRQAA